MRPNLDLNELREQGITPGQQLKDILAVCIGEHDGTSKMADNEYRYLHPQWHGNWRDRVVRYLRSVVHNLKWWQGSIRGALLTLEQHIFKFLTALEKNPAVDTYRETIYKIGKIEPPDIHPSDEQYERIALDVLGEFQALELREADEAMAYWNSVEDSAYFYDVDTRWLDTDLTDYEPTAEDMNAVYEHVAFLGIAGDEEVLDDVFDAIWVYRELTSLYNRIENRSKRKRILADAFNSADT